MPFWIEPRVAAGLKKVGLRNADRLIDMPLPLNLRLASRIADYAGTLTTLPQLEPGGQPTDIFQRLIDSYTFLPSRYDEGLWVQILPGMGPVPSWLLHGLPVEGDGALPKIRDLVSAIYPTFDYNETRSTVSLLDPLGSMRSFADFVFPTPVSASDASPNAGRGAGHQPGTRKPPVAAVQQRGAAATRLRQPSQTATGGRSA